MCRANLCRSPIAARMVMGRLAERGETATVLSAGLEAGQSEPEDGLIASTREWGIDLAGHHSRQLTVEDVRSATIVLAMEHHQVAEILALDPEAFSRTFTLKELVRRSDDIGKRRDDEPFENWIARLHAGRTRLGLVGAWHNDVTDPAGKPSAEVERTIAELDLLTASLVSLAWPRVRSRRGR